MSMRCFISMGLVFLAALIVGCTPTETDAGGEISEATAELDVVEEKSIVPEEQLADSPAMARLETCEVDPFTADRIREAENRLEDLRLRFTDKHPDVIATIRMLDNLVRAELDECVEHLQAR